MNTSALCTSISHRIPESLVWISTASKLDWTGPQAIALSNFLLTSTPLESTTPWDSCNMHGPCIVEAVPTEMQDKEPEEPRYNISIYEIPFPNFQTQNESGLGRRPLPSKDLVGPTSPCVPSALLIDIRKTISSHRRGCLCCSRCRNQDW